MPSKPSFTLFFSICLAYTLPINRVNQLEFVFSNPLETDLAIEYINLLIELQEQQDELDEQNENTNQIELFLMLSDGEQNKRSFAIPAKSKHFKLKFGFFYEKLAKFKIIGK